MWESRLHQVQMIIWFASMEAAFLASAEQLPHAKLALGQPCQRTRDCVPEAECVPGSNPSTRVCRCPTDTSYELADKSACVVYLDGTAGRIVRYVTVNGCNASSQCGASSSYSSDCVTIPAAGRSPDNGRCLCNESALMSVDRRRCFRVSAYVPHDCQWDGDCQNVAMTAHCVLDLNRGEDPMRGCLCDPNTRLTFDESSCLAAGALTNFSCQSDSDCAAKATGARRCVFRTHNAYGTGWKRCMLDSDAEERSESSPTPVGSASSDQRTHHIKRELKSAPPPPPPSPPPPPHLHTSSTASAEKSLTLKAIKSSGLEPPAYGVHMSNSSDHRTHVKRGPKSPPPSPPPLPHAANSSKAPAAKQRQILKASKSSGSEPPDYGVRMAESNSPDAATVSGSESARESTASSWRQEVPDHGPRPSQNSADSSPWDVVARVKRESLNGTGREALGTPDTSNATSNGSATESPGNATITTTTRPRTGSIISALIGSTVSIALIAAGASLLATVVGCRKQRAKKAAERLKEAAMEVAARAQADVPETRPDPQLLDPQGVDSRQQASCDVDYDNDMDSVDSSGSSSHSPPKPDTSESRDTVRTDTSMQTHTSQ